MDRIFISDLRGRCIIGVNEEERHEKQDVVINVVIFTDLRKPGKSDRLEDTVDYRALKERLVAVVEGSHYHLVEALAEAVAQICLEHPAVHRVRVRVEKPSALRAARSAGVEMVRRKMS